MRLNGGRIGEYHVIWGDDAGDVGGDEVCAVSPENYGALSDQQIVQRSMISLRLIMPFHR